MRPTQAADSRLAHGDECRDAFSRDKVVHDVSAHLWCSIEEPEQFRIVALRDGEPDRERVRDGPIPVLVRREFRERVVEFCVYERDQPPTRSVLVLSGVHGT